MASVCKSVIGCVNDNAQVPVRRTFANHYTPESDAEFVRSLISAEKKKQQQTRKPWGPSPLVVGSYSCRQVYLRSYRFTKKEEKESVSQKMMKCFGKVKEKLANFPFAARHERDSSSTNKNKNKNKAKASCTAIPSTFFGCLLPDTASVDFVDRR